MKDFTARFAGLATLALAALPMAALTTAAHAQATRMVVADINFQTPAGQRTLAHRIAHVKHEICSTERNITQKQACEAAVASEAQEKVAAIASSTQFAAAGAPAH